MALWYYGVPEGYRVPEEYRNASKQYDFKTALGAEEVVSWEYRENAADVIKDLRKKGYEILFLEQTDKSISFEQIKLSGPMCIVLGNEVSGVSDDIISLCDKAVEIEMSGIKNSLNVSVAFGILAYHVRNLLK